MPTPRTIKPGPGSHHTTALTGKPMGKPVVIDATGLVLGRMASHVAKRLLGGDPIVIINAEAAVVTGTKDALVFEYKKKRDAGTDRNGPFFPRMPDRIVKRTVRGMLPNASKRGNGKAAFRRLRVYIGRPEDVKGNAETIDTARTEAAQTMTVGELARYLGAKF